MLSIFDLLSAGTLDLDLAAWLMARISRGASFLVGAAPGGAGKTTVMCALLNFVPADAELTAATPEIVGRTGADKAGPRRCFVCHEIGPGPYFAYLWGEDLRQYCRLGQAGHLLATNLHADDLSQATSQICGDNGVPAEHFNRFHLLIFLRVEGSSRNARRVVRQVYDSDGRGRRQAVYEAGAGRLSRRTPDDGPAEARYLRACRDFLRRNRAAGTRTIEQTREQVLRFLAEYEEISGIRS